jgi:hypothetical protein
MTSKELRQFNLGKKKAYTHATKDNSILVYS